VFTSPEGHPLRRTKLRPRWADACTEAGVTGLHLHDLRGSGARWAATTGATVAELMARLGHRTPTVAMRYQHATVERDRAIADKLIGCRRTDPHVLVPMGTGCWSPRKELTQPRDKLGSWRIRLIVNRRQWSNIDSRRHLTCLPLLKRPVTP
jgi:hypothetical protein